MIENAGSNHVNLTCFVCTSHSASKLVELTLVFDMAQHNSSQIHSFDLNMEVGSPQMFRVKNDHLIGKLLALYNDLALV